jgi:hypothetical protein
MSWHPEDPRSWGGWPPHDPRWGRHQPTWGWGHPGRPLYDNQLGHRLPTGGPPARGELSMLVALGLFLLSPVTLFAWAAGQLLLRVTGIRWWKLALASLAAIAAVLPQREGRHRPWPTTSPATWAGCGRSAIRLSTCPCRGRSCGPSSPWPSRSGCWPPRSTWPAGGRPSTRPRSASSSARPSAAWSARSSGPPTCATTTSARSPWASRSTATWAGLTSVVSWSSHG